MLYEEVEFKCREFIPMAEIIKRNYNGRKILLYGDSGPLRYLLKTAFEVDANIVVTGIKEKASESLRYIRDFAGLSNDYYIVVPFLNPDVDIKNMLVSIGYNEFFDFVFKFHNRIISDKGFKNYHDEYGNHITAPAGVTVILDPQVGDVQINIDETTEFAQKSAIHIMGACTRVYIAEKCKFLEDFKLNCYGNTYISVGSKTSVGYGNFFSIPCGGKIVLGSDCMLSNDINLYCGDGHAIFDVETGKRTLDIENENPKNSIIIGDHVWVGLNATILNNTVIERSSIVGAGSVVKGKFPNNCAIAGNPAKIIKRNVTWSRNILETDIHNCGKENVKMTVVF